MTYIILGFLKFRITSDLPFELNWMQKEGVTKHVALSD
jgi:hypothetical protein